MNLFVNYIRRILCDPVVKGWLTGLQPVYRRGPKMGPGGSIPDLNFYFMKRLNRFYGSLAAIHANWSKHTLELPFSPQSTHSLERKTNIDHR
jgi:hypothetical protein